MQLDFGPLMPLLQDDDVTEIMVNAWDNVFIERGGKLQSAPFRFVDARALEDLVRGILFAGGRDPSRALCFDGQLPGGARYNITLPPMSPNGPTLTLRKHAPAVSTLENLVRRKLLSPKAAQFLSACVRGRINIVISGGTGTGKTTLLNAMASLIPPQERIVTIEDTAELRIRHPNWIRLEAVKDGQPQVDIKQCVVNALRMRPDRILVGECRSSEAGPMLQAMNTGHEGSLTTVHANTPSDCLSRLETLLMTTESLPHKAIRRQVADAIDLIVQLRRGREGQRALTEILEVVGMEGETITRATLFHLPDGKSSGADLKSTGLVPNFLKRLEERDVKLPRNFFDAAYEGQF